MAREHDEESGSISVVEEPLSQVARKFHGTDLGEESERRDGSSGVEKQANVNSGGEAGGRSCTWHRSTGSMDETLIGPVTRYVRELFSFFEVNVER
jgi:hypothetical protein